MPSDFWMGPLVGGSKPNLFRTSPVRIGSETGSSFQLSAVLTVIYGHFLHRNLTELGRAGANACRMRKPQSSLAPKSSRVVVWATSLVGTVSIVRNRFHFDSLSGGHCRPHEVSKNRSQKSAQTRRRCRLARGKTDRGEWGGPPAIKAYCRSCTRDCNSSRLGL